ncbi:uncharacterized protein LOC126559340 [Anopheles maculipalpis]|uniref:uncharacterized protein LOC126559340 n=1 Tax=Anopheles maculipalpis TaxID=1496333 RepID=UPI0021590137|nr:uncharacterized protein LOC126559340 [Anopheles maculipalpis]
MPPCCNRETMTVGSVKHPNVLPQPAAASTARVAAAYDYPGTGSSGGGISGTLAHGAGSLRTNGTAGSGRISHHSSATSSTTFGMMRSSTIRTLFGRPDPNDTRRIYEEHVKAERQRVIAQYAFDPKTGHGLTSVSSSSSSGGLHHHLHHQ